MLKLVRNAFAMKGVYLGMDEKIVAWSYMEQLHKLEEKESLHFANKLRTAHVE